MSDMITVEAIINKEIEKVWNYYNTPEHVIKWNAASEDWYTPSAINDFRVNGSFTYRMEARDGSEGFDFSGVYDEIVDSSLIKYSMEDGRRVEIVFKEENQKTVVTVSFDPETVYPPEFQKEGWQSILNNFKKYVES